MATAPQRPFRAGNGQRATVGEIFAPLADVPGRTQELVGKNGVVVQRPLPADKRTVDLAKLPLLSKLDRHLVLWMALGLPAQEIAEKCGKSLGWLTLRVKHEAVAAALKRIEDLSRAKIERGDYGVAPIAKAEAEPMTRILVGIAKSHKTAPAVKRQAALDVLALAGHQPVKRAEILNVNELIEKMTPEELDRFIQHDEWPERMRDSSMAAMTKKAAIDVTPVDIFDDDTD